MEESADSLPSEHYDDHECNEGVQLRSSSKYIANWHYVCFCETDAGSSTQHS